MASQCGPEVTTGITSPPPALLAQVCWDQPWTIILGPPFWPPRARLGPEPQSPAREPLWEADTGHASATENEPSDRSTQSPSWRPPCPIPWSHPRKRCRRTLRYHLPRGPWLPPLGQAQAGRPGHQGAPTEVSLGIPRLAGCPPFLR